MYWCAVSEAPVVVTEEWAGEPEAGRDRCASEPAGSVPEKALAAWQIHLHTKHKKPQIYENRLRDECE